MHYSTVAVSFFNKTIIMMVYGFAKEESHSERESHCLVMV
jgi:hypothetical protein